MRLQSRIERLEKRASHVAELPWVILNEDSDAPGVFYDDLDMYHFRRGERSERPERYTEEDFPKLEQRSRLIIVHLAYGTGAAELPQYPGPDEQRKAWRP